jgi:hypothetical protein
MYKTVPPHIDAAIAAHEAWKARLLDAIQAGVSEWNPRTVKADNQCDFGKWLYGCPPAVRSSPHYGIVKKIHAQFHMEAGRVLEIALAGNKDYAIADMAGQYTQISSSLVDELLKWKEAVQGGELP